MNRKITSGTREWADSNVSCYYGCSNNCRYCYSKKMAIRFKRKTETTWKIMEPNSKQIKKNYGKRKGRIIFPTSHDITEKSLSNCMIVLNKLLKAGNNVLITTKPKLACIKALCVEFRDYKELIQFMFTITSINNEFLKFWELTAPSFEERLKSLKYAYNEGYKTSISIEPLLDKNPVPLIDKIILYVTESIWIGKMNYIKKSNLNPDERKYYEKIKAINSRKNLREILKHLKKYDESIIQIKDSIYNYLYKK